MRPVLIAGILFWAVHAAGACGFQHDPVSGEQYYRAAGWDLPGIRDFNPSAPPHAYGAPPPGTIPGAKAYLLSHDEDPYIVEFPIREFVLNGATRRMRAMQAKATLLRWEVNGHVVAYSYGLTPVRARRHKGNWVVESEAGCVFYATFIDDKGDGIFRTLVPSVFTPDLVPKWAKAPTT